ncbi:unnamed protein product, partial [marine sediment metagenome]
DCKVATFHQVSGNILYTRDYEVIGTVTTGEVRTFTVNLEVKKGDFIGLYAPDGYLGAKELGYSGVWYVNADKIPCTEYTFSYINARGLMLFGSGEGYK